MRDVSTETLEIIGNYFLKCYIAKRISLSFNCFSEYISDARKTATILTPSKFCKEVSI